MAVILAFALSVRPRAGINDDIAIVRRAARSAGHFTWIRDPEDGSLICRFVAGSQSESDSPPLSLSA